MFIDADVNRFFCLGVNHDRHLHNHDRESHKPRLWFLVLSGEGLEIVVISMNFDKVEVED